MEQVVCKNIQWEKINVWCCGAFFPSENIMRHQEEAHSDNVKPVEQSYICGVCGKSFSRRCAAKVHKRIHKSQFTCDFCKMGFRQKSFSDKHKKICQSSVTTDRIGHERNSDCAKKTKEAGRLDKDSDTVAISVISEHVIKVNAVKNVISIDNLKSSMGADWNEKKDGVVNKEKTKCSEDKIDDNVRFSGNINGNLDSFKEHENNYQTEGKGKINDTEICNICGASIASDNMSKHVKHIHTMNDVKNFVCEYCGKSFKWKHGLNYHIALHTGQMNFSCLFCDKKFRRKYEVQECENKHNDIFKHSCHLCEYKTNDKWALNRHVNSHLNIKPYSCPVCKLKKGTKSDLRYHIRRQHETDGSIISHLEVLYPQMYNASEPNEGWRNDPLFQNLVPAKQSTGKRKWNDQTSVEYPNIVRNIDNNNSATKKKRKLFSPKSQKCELFPEVDESGLNETPKHLEVLVKGIKHFANESIMTNSSVRDDHDMQNMADVIREVFNERNDENLFQGVPPLDQSLYEYSLTEVNQTI